MKEHIDSCHKMLERRAAYLEQRTAHFEYAAKITVDSTSVLTQGGGNGSEKYHDCWVNPYNKNDVDKSTKKNASEAI